MAEPETNLKAVQRQFARKRLLGLTIEEKQSAARSIREQLLTLAIWQNARSVLLFAPRPDEPDIWPLAESGLQAGKNIALPRFVSATQSYEAALIKSSSDVQPGQYGILEPSPVCNVADSKRLDLVLVPGLAFDWHGHRLGRGKGFYDRLLATVSGKTCGIAFDIQLTSDLPVEPHDIRLNCILTPSHWLEF